MSADNIAVCPNCRSDPPSFREDWEIYGAEQGVVHVYYDGKCRVCNAGLVFNFHRGIPVK